MESHQNKICRFASIRKTRLDLNYIIGEMIAELACGHAYVNPGEIKGPERIKMGLLGAELNRDKSGFYRIEKILPGAIYSQKLRSPLTEPGLGVKKVTTSLPSTVSRLPL